jgi:energy-coupling factor transporter transmembrane protein EcfT
MNGLHPSVRIIFLLGLGVAVQLMQWPGLALAAITLAALLLYLRATLVFKILRRARWLLIFLLLIYAYTTPGEYLHGFQSDFLPTYEGIASGMLQITRLMLVLAGLALLLATTRRGDMMAGTYLLLRPLRLLGFSPERFAARLWLTLHYVEQTPLPRGQALRHLLANFHSDLESASGMEKVVIVLPRFGWLDALVLAMLFGLAMLL